MRPDFKPSMAGLGTAPKKPDRPICAVCQYGAADHSYQDFQWGGCLAGTEETGYCPCQRFGPPPDKPRRAKPVQGGNQPNAPGGPFYAPPDTGQE